MRFLKLAVLSISILPMGLQAAPAKEPKASFWERKTCYTQGIAQSLYYRCPATLPGLGRTGNWDLPSSHS